MTHTLSEALGLMVAPHTHRLRATPDRIRKVPRQPKYSSRYRMRIGKVMMPAPMPPTTTLSAWYRPWMNARSTATMEGEQARPNPIPEERVIELSETVM